MTGFLSPAWQEQSACAGSPDLFFSSDDEETAGDRRRRVTKAQIVCARCPVQADCLSLARDCDATWGVWGGIDFERTPRLLCGKGLHQMTEDNVFADSGGYRNCRACRDAYDQLRRERQQRKAA